MTIDQETAHPAPISFGAECAYNYSFYLHPDETWGRTAMGEGHPVIPQAVFRLFHMIKYRVEMVFTPLEFVRFRHDVESFGITLREISRVPYHQEETVL